MERKNLTLEIASCYMPCKAVIEIDEAEEVYEIQGGAFINNRILCFDNKGHSIWLSLNDTWAKLILTPLYDVSEEHKIHVGKISSPDIDDEHHLMNIGSSVIVDIFNGRIIMEFGATRMQEIIDYLRSKSYDLGHGSIPSLIEAGIAIKST